MALEQMTEAPGWWKCSLTGYVGREVTDVIQLVRANGVIMLDDSGGVMWLAGRDLRNAILSVVKRLGLAGAPTLDQLKGYLNRKRFFNGTHLDEIEHDTSTILSMRVWDDGTVVSRTGQKILAAPNRLFAGAFYGPGWNSATVASPWDTHVLHADDPRFTSLGRSINAWHSPISAGAINSPPVWVNGAQPDGVGVVQIPLGMSWDSWLDRAFGSLRNWDKSEVQSKMNPIKARMRDYLTSSSNGPVLNVPVGMSRTGTFKIAMPRSFRRMVPTNATYGTPTGKIIVTPIAFGGTAWNPEGYAMTCPLGASALEGGANWRPDGSMVDGRWSSGVVSSWSDWIDGVGFVNSGGIDDVPFGWFFGVLSAPFNLSGQAFANAEGPFTARDTLLAAYRATITPDNDVTLPTQQTVNDELETQEQMWERYAMTNPAPESYEKVGVSSWDQQGVSHSLASLLFAQAITDESYNDSYVNAIGKQGVSRPAGGVQQTRSKTLQLLGSRPVEAFSPAFANLWSDPSKIGVVA